MRYKNKISSNILFLLRGKNEQEPNYKKLFIQAILGVVSLLIAIIALVVFVDPYQQYRASNYFIGNQRLENPGVACHQDYDFVLTGSSMAMNHYTTQVDSLFLCKSINLSIMGATFYDYQQLLQVLHRVDKAHTVLMSLDYFSFCRPIIPLDTYLYDESVFNDYQYWLNYTSIKNVVNKIFLSKETSRDSVYRFKSPNGEKYLFESYKGSLNHYFYNENYDLDVMKQTFDKLLPYLFTKDNKINYIFYFPPYSILEYKQYQHYGYLDNILAFKKYICSQLFSHDGVKIYDFQSHPMVFNYDSYMDLRHHSHSINRLVIDMIYTDSCRLTEANFHGEIERWNKLVRNFEIEDSIIKKWKLNVRK